ncbi:uncharacterized protein LOC144559969 [Carex rostrata]
MQYVGITHLPDHYILKRWTKGANASVKRSISKGSMDSGESAELLTLRKASLKSDWMELTDLGAVSAEAYICMKEIIASGKQKLLLVLDKQAQGGCLPSLEEGFKEGSANEEFNANPIFHDPRESQCKGRKKISTRFVPPSLKKRRTCSICGEKEGHNSRTCPMLKINGKGKRKAVADEESGVHKMAEIYESEEDNL